MTQRLTALLMIAVLALSVCPVWAEGGVTVTDIRYFGSQNWPFPHTLLAAFTAEYDGGEVRPDGEEIAEAAWFDVRSPLPPIPQPGSISRAMIDDFLVHSKPQPDRVGRQTP